MKGRETDEKLLATADAFVRSRLSKKRYSHTIRVADTAEKLARIHGLDTVRVRLGALLHDAARELKPGEYLALAEEWRIPLGGHEKENPKILHGPVAAELASRELGIEDGEVLEAIRAHTVGSPGMGMISLCVYVADKIEPARDYPSVRRLRELAERDLHESAAQGFSEDLGLQRGVWPSDASGQLTNPGMARKNHLSPDRRAIRGTPQEVARPGRRRSPLPHRYEPRRARA